MQFDPDMIEATYTHTGVKDEYQVDIYVIGGGTVGKFYRENYWGVRITAPGFSVQGTTYYIPWGVTHEHAANLFAMWQDEERN